MAYVCTLDELQRNDSYHQIEAHAVIKRFPHSPYAVARSHSNLSESLGASLSAGHFRRVMMASSPSVFSLEGQGLRLETAADIEPYLKELQSNAGVREIRLGGNTFGVEACKALADILRSKESLEVGLLLPTLCPSLHYPPPARASIFKVEKSMHAATVYGMKSVLFVDLHHADRQSCRYLYVSPR